MALFELSIGETVVHVAAPRESLGDGQFGNRHIANVKGRHGV
jgi:hypothetical protein